VFNFHEANIEFGVSTVNGKGWYLDKNGYWIDIELFANKSEILTHIVLQLYAVVCRLCAVEKLRIAAVMCLVLF